MPTSETPVSQRDGRLFKLLRRTLAGAKGMRSKHGASLALDILAANGIDEIAVARAGGRPVHLSTRDKVIASEVIRTGSFGRANMEAFAALLRAAGLDPAGLAFVNVGANIGTTCLNAYDAGFRELVAVEPEPANFGLLQRNLAGLAGAQVRCLQVAVGEAEGRARLHRHPTNLGSHSLLGAKSDRRGGDDTVEVAVETLATVVPEALPFVLFVDVEGFEPQVVRGGANVIAQGCRAMALEITPARYAPADAADLVARLSAFSGRLVLLPSGETHPTAMLGRLMESHGRGHFDVALVREPG